MAVAAVLALPGAAHAGVLSKATARWPLPANASAINLGGVVLVSSAESTGKARWDALLINGASWYGKDSTGPGFRYVGVLAAAGPTLDFVNGAPCRSIPDGSVCVTVLDGSAQADDENGFSSAHGSIASLAASSRGRGGSLHLLPAAAETGDECARSASALAAYGYMLNGIADTGTIDGSSAEDCNVP